MFNKTPLIGVLFYFISYLDIKLSMLANLLSNIMVRHVISCIPD